MTSMPISWHQQCEWEVEAAYFRGYQAGLADASERMDAALREAIDPGPDVNPAARRAVLGRSAKDVVEMFVKTLDLGPAIMPCSLPTPIRSRRADDFDNEELAA